MVVVAGTKLQDQTSQIPSMDRLGTQESLSVAEQLLEVTAVRAETVIFP